MVVRAMDTAEVDEAIAVWLAANAARGRTPSNARQARVHDKLHESGTTTCVAANPAVVGMALAEPGRESDGAGPVLPGLLHVSMVFVRPSAQRRGVGGALMRHVFEVATDSGHRRLSLWTAADNAPARRLYESVGMVAVARRQVSVATEWLRYERGLG